MEMGREHKLRRFDKGTEARRAAREKAAKPGATQRIPDRRKKILSRIERREERNG
jgi:hypothetical protein